MATKKRNRKRFWVTWMSGAQQITERETTLPRAIQRAHSVAVRIDRPVTYGCDRRTIAEIRAA